MKFLSVFRNMCVNFYKTLCINFSRNYIYILSIVYISLIFILFIVYDIYTGDFEYCISHEIENELSGDSSTSVQKKQTNQTWEFNRHTEDLANSTIRLVCQTPELTNAANSPICGSASTVSEDWSTRAVVGVNGDNQSEVVDGKGNSENISVKSSCSNTDPNKDNLSELGARIDETIRGIKGNNSTRSTLLGEIPSGESSTVNEATRAEAIHSMRWALTQSKDTSELTPNDLQQLGLILQQLSEAERDLRANLPEDVNNNSNWSLETNNSNKINWDMRREIIKQQVEDQIEQREISKVEDTQLNKIEKIKSDIDILKSKIESLYNKYYNAGKRRLFWNIWEKYRGNFDTYKEFKEYSGPEMKIRTELKRFWDENGNPFGKNNDKYHRR